MCVRIHFLYIKRFTSYSATWANETALQCFRKPPKNWWAFSGRESERDRERSNSLRYFSYDNGKDVVSLLCLRTHLPFPTFPATQTTIFSSLAFLIQSLMMGFLILPFYSGKIFIPMKHSPQVFRTHRAASALRQLLDIIYIPFALAPCLLTTHTPILPSSGIIYSLRNSFSFVPIFY